MSAPANAPDLGSLLWGQETSGLLERRERRALRGLILTDIARYAGSRLRTLTGRGRRSARASLQVIEVPDTKLARAVETVARSHQSPGVVAHALRSVAFAHAIADLDGIDVDPELLWCACLLHDVALEDPVADECFAVRGGRIARATALEAGVSDDRADLLGDTISRHVTPGLDPRRHPLPAALTAGALVDVIGNRLDDLDPAFVKDVLATQPRDGFAPAIARALRAEAQAVHGGRIALARRTALLPTAARFAPLPR